MSRDAQLRLSSGRAGPAQEPATPASRCSRSLQLRAASELHEQSCPQLPRSRRPWATAPMDMAKTVRPTTTRAARKVAMAGFYSASAPLPTSGSRSAGKWEVARAAKRSGPVRTRK